MRYLNDRVLLSASDLMRFAGCTHATALDRQYMLGNGPVPREDSDDAALLQKQGDAHEAAHLARLKDERRHVIEIERGDLARDAVATRVALSGGPDVIFQGALLSGHWGGWSDFLERVDKPSERNDEIRTLAICPLTDRLIAVVYTMRGDICRIISARAARKNEQRAYRQVYP